MTFLPNCRRLAGLTLGMLLASSAAPAQEKTHRLEIYNGPTRTVHYYTDGMSQGERSSLANLQRLENEMSATDQLAALRGQYIRDEREMQRRRVVVQNLLYGNSTTYGSGLYPGSFGWGYGSSFGYGYPLASAYPFLGGAGGGFGPGYVGSAGTTTQSLAFGMGDEGVIKNELARTLAAQSSPAYATAVRQEYYSALDQASREPRLAQALGLEPGKVVGAEFTRSAPPGMGLSQGDQVTLLGKGGEKVEGKFVRESGDWVTVNTGTEQVTLRKSEIARFSRK